MRVRFHQAALDELRDGFDYYEQIRTGLGAEMAREFAQVIEKIRRFPHGYPRISRRNRSCLLQRFPYAVIYHVRDDVLFIIAAAHTARKPGYWMDRKME